MASSKDYLDYILEQLGGAEDISSRAMMGEYIIYCQGKVIGGIYDNRFLVKPTAAARKSQPSSYFSVTPSHFILPEVMMMSHTPEAAAEENVSDGIPVARHSIITAVGTYIPVTADIYAPNPIVRIPKSR